MRGKKGISIELENEMIKCHNREGKEEQKRWIKQGVREQVTKKQTGLFKECPNNKDGRY